MREIYFEYAKEFETSLANLVEYENKYHDFYKKIRDIIAGKLDKKHGRLPRLVKGK